MKNLLLPILLSFALNLSAQQLKQHRWQNRLLILVDDEVNSDKILTQLVTLKKDKTGLAERKLIVYQFSPKGYRKGLSDNSDWLSITKKNNPLPLNSKTFNIYLIGLDGDIKMQKQSPVNLSTIFALIDGMPMRQAELRNGKKQSSTKS